jgi:hypothetical protein
MYRPLARSLACCAYGGACGCHLCGCHLRGCHRRPFLRIHKRDARPPRGARRLARSDHAPRSRARTGPRRRARARVLTLAVLTPRCALSWARGAQAFALEPSPLRHGEAAEAVGHLELFAERFRAAGPRFLLCRGTLAFLLGRPTVRASKGAGGRESERAAVAPAHARGHPRVRARATRHRGGAAAPGAPRCAAHIARARSLASFVPPPRHRARRRPAARGARR